MSTAEAVKTRKQLASEARDLIESAKAIQAKGDEATPEEMEEAAKAFESARAISDRLATSVKGMPGAEAIESTLGSLKAERNAPLLPTGERPDEKGKANDALKSMFGETFDPGDDGAQMLTPQQSIRLAVKAFLADDGVRDYLNRIAPNGRISAKTNIQTPKVMVDVRELANKLGPEAMKTIIYSGSATSSGAMTFAVQRPDIVAPVPGFGQLGVSDLVTRIPVDSDAVEWIRVTGVTNNAAIVAEASATAGASGQKPESAMAFVRKTTPIETVAHWIPATTRTLSDVRRLRAEIEAFLRRGLERGLDVQIIQGDGVGDNLTGVLTDTDILTQAFATDLLVTTRKALTNIQVNWQVGEPTAYVFHPADWETLELTQDNEARFYFGGPMARLTPVLWGIRVVTTLAMTSGTAVLADWREGMLFDREQTQVSASNSHADFFIRNMVAILAELRAGFGIRSPKAFCEIDLTA